MIILTIIIILVTIILIFIKPGELFARVRDSSRYSNLRNIESSINQFQTDSPNGFLGTSTNIYISLPDSSATCSSWLNKLPQLINNFSYHCVSADNLALNNGNGWIPVNLNSDPLINFTLPVDPKNSPNHYYTYVVTPTNNYEVVAIPENNFQPAINDGGLDPALFEVGTDNSYYDPGLTIDWNFHDGTGTSASSAYKFNQDVGSFKTASSTCGSNCYPQWTTSNCPKNCLFFNGTSTQSYVESSNLYNYCSGFTFSAWVYPYSVNSTGVIITSGGYKDQIMKQSNNMLFGNVYDNYLPSTLQGSAFNQPNQWYFVTFTFDAKTLLAGLYVNGVQIASNVLGNGYGYCVGNDIVGTGTQDAGGSGSFYGLIDNVKIYNYALSADQIKSLYQGENL